MFYVYVIYNPTAKKIYIGQTSDIEKRLIRHNNKFGNHFTAKFEGEWILIYKESLPTRSEAIKREKQLKSSRGRAHLTKYIPGKPG
jgi:putative endonuclease